MQIRINENFSITYKLTEDEKKELLTAFSDNFTQAHQLMKWMDDVNVSKEERLGYFSHMFFIFQTMDRLLRMLLDAGFSETEIITALNELPF